MSIAEVVSVGSALVCALACTALAWAHLWHLSSLGSLELRAGADELRQLALAARCDRLARQAPAGSWQRLLIDELRAASDERHRLAAVNEALMSVDFELQRWAAWPQMAIWLAAGSTALAIIGGLLAGGRLPVLWALLPGAGGIALAVWAKREGRRRIARSRRAIDRFVEVLAGELSESALETPQRRVKRWQRAR